jgi:hypothetical protein
MSLDFTDHEPFSSGIARFIALLAFQPAVPTYCIGFHFVGVAKLHPKRKKIPPSSVCSDEQDFHIGAAQSVCPDAAYRSSAALVCKNPLQTV